MTRNFPLRRSNKERGTPGRVNGAAIELIGASRQKMIYAGTYRNDLPDQNFRFKIAMIDETDAFPLHTHEYEELVIVLSGRAIHLTEFEDYPLEAGDVFVIHSGCKHGLKDPRGLKLCLLMYDPAQLLTGRHDLHRMMGYHALFAADSESRQTEFRTRLHLSAEQMGYTSSLLATMKSEFETASVGRQTIIKSCFLLLVAFLSRVYAAQKRDTGTPLVRLAKVISHIQNNYGQPLSVSELARLAHWSPSQFQRNFKRVYNTTPNQFITRVRLQEAGELLRDPNRDITSIAYDTGFASSSFFATRFKRYFGESPSEYRRRKLTESERQSSVTRVRIQVTPGAIPAA